MNKPFLLKLIGRYGPAIASVFVLILILVNIVLPSISKIKNLSQNIFMEREKLEELYLKGQSLKHSTEECNKIKNQISELKNIFLAKGDELRLITNLENLASQNNVSKEINIQENKSDTNSEKISVDLHVVGTYSNLINYLQSIESLDIYVDFKSLNFSVGNNLKRVPQIPTTQNSADPEITLTASGFVYY